MVDTNKTYSFALGGLGGSNSHGVGFLAAAQELGLKPKAISCSSGQIHWTAAFLRHKDLREELQKQIDMMPRLKEPFAEFSGIPLSVKGLPGVFKPAFMQQMLGGWDKIPTSKEDVINRMFPAQTMVPTRDPKFFSDIADTFNKTDIAIIFNSVNPENGVEYVHVNEAARAMLSEQYKHLGDLANANRVIKGGSDDVFEYHELKPITAEYVEAALWLLQYGFVKRFSGDYLFDGAYRRQLIVRELIGVDTIFVVRPQAYEWQGDLPKNYFEMEDFKIEMLFNGSYGGEVASINLLNYLHKLNVLNQDKYRPIELIEIEIGSNRGYFDYFFESMETFDASRRTTISRVNKWR